MAKRRGTYSAVTTAGDVTRGKGRHRDKATPSSTEDNSSSVSSGASSEEPSKEASNNESRGPSRANESPSKRQRETTSFESNYAPCPTSTNLITMPDKDSRITQIATKANEHIAALRLVADSVAQQRQLAAGAVLCSPLCWALIPLVPACIYYSPYQERVDNLTIFLLCIGISMAFGVAVKWSVRGYLDAAEKVGTWRWLYGFEDKSKTKARRQETDTKPMHMDEGSHIRSMGSICKRDFVLVARLTDDGDIIGTIILRVVPITTSSEKASRSKSSQKRCQMIHRSPQPCKVVIRAWTVKQSHRGAGIGAWMLKDALVLCLQYGWMGPEFAADHANSVRVLPSVFNGWIDRMEARAKNRLARDIEIFWAKLEEGNEWAMRSVI
ncbi:uncharacterized protein N7482_009176 [Penicillium canariense]|uniref:Uncharacterized protein n=1 Tax=Penicillium canariense TaxID=189055 RepID=A0A9W9HPN9_9EURO|nr:uncharacterized protein N7482_009176 [Penicillium canariense]KAJ5152698.1 hypothetical protein N7482_009176 [Penicillium canariense]